MNLPLPADLRGRFSVVHDSGTLEHVFNKDRLVLAKLGFDQPCFRRLDEADVLRGKLA